MQPAQTFNPLPTTPLGFTFLLYVYLQGLDLLTTLAFLLSGVEEGNPVVRFAMEASGNPLTGLLLVKAIALALGLYCWIAGKGQLLRRVNVAYAALIAWNLVCLILGLLTQAA
ncbi:MAG TPA: DUF5658 family protein [Bryobacteraceae bacterium]|nr:hypothetical protein [Bryobacterales bacterium]HRJ21159.1 DUF5658 family protein [Bryobacteraceae bacterium]